jgi:hypothetical protein
VDEFHDLAQNAQVAIPHRTAMLIVPERIFDL